MKRRLDMLRRITCICLALLLGACAGTSEMPSTSPPPEPPRPAAPAPAPAPAPKPAPVPASPPAPKPAAPAPAKPTAGPPAPAPEVKVEAPVFPIWYATDRRVNVNNKGGYEYDDASIPGTRYGRVDVEVPIDLLTKLRKQGFAQVVMAPMEAGVVLRPAQPMVEQVFLRELRKHISQQDADSREVLLYVHGFRTTYEDAIRRAAVLGFNLRVGTTAAFVWASRGTLAGYQDDQKTALANVQRLANYIALLAQRTGATQMHIVAHSMGNEILMRAMNQPAVLALTQGGFKFGQIILAAPDVDIAKFESGAKAYRDKAKRVTLYATQKDVALLASWGVMNGYRRAGTLPPPKGLTFIDTVDVTDVDFTALKHAALANSLAVFEDMYLLLYGNIPPKRRQYIFPVKSKEGDYWKLQ